MDLARITKDRLKEAQRNGYTAIITTFNADPLKPTWIFEKIEKEDFPQVKRELEQTYQLCYSITEALETIDDYPFIGMVNLPN
ncbi:hypothetical protein [Sphingobacterium suaedae]|uniref:Uncharacterized protein n=1 Tax=Sphingobacterium suaedae TaxID=1686402 RepID=A0ABW5KGJ4_9SPHI